MRDRRAVRRLIKSRRAALEADGISATDAVAAVWDEHRAGAFGAIADAWVHEDVHLADKDAAFAAARAGGKIEAHAIVAASRIYTPDYIVSWLLQNTLGALWLAMHPGSTMRARWPLLVESAVGPAREPRPLSQLTLLDPCCGCGAFLVAAFDMLLALAQDERRLAQAGAIPADWPSRDPARTVVARCLWGADLDREAVQIVRRELRTRSGYDPGDHLWVAQLPLGTLDPDAVDRRFDVVCTNPPYIGFRQLDAAIRDAVRHNDPDAGSDLAVAFQSRCVDLLADGGRCGTVTPSGWTNGRESVGLRRRILAQGAPCAMAPLGQRVFDAAPLLFVSLNVIARGPAPADLAVVHASERSALGLAQAAVRPIPLTTIRALDFAPFTPDAPAPVLRLAATNPRVRDHFRSFDGIWTGSNTRDVRPWWRVDAADVWVPLSGGQGHQPWVTPVRLRMRAGAVATQPDRSGGIEYPRVAGRRLGARLAPPHTASLAGVVTFVPRHGEADARVHELLAVFNSRIGGAWLRTLTSGLNFNPGYAAEIPLGGDSPGPDLLAAAAEAIAVRGAMVAADPTHDGFAGVPTRQEGALLVDRWRTVDALLDDLVADHLRIARGVMMQLPPAHRNAIQFGGLDDVRLVAALRALGFRWPTDGPPARPPEVCSIDELADAVDAAVAAHGDCDGQEAIDWVRRRFVATVEARFRGGSLVLLRGDEVQLGGSAVSS